MSAHSVKNVFGPVSSATLLRARLLIERRLAVRANAGDILEADIENMMNARKTIRLWRNQLLEKLCLVTRSLILRRSPTLRPHRDGYLYYFWICIKTGYLP